MMEQAAAAAFMSPPGPGAGPTLLFALVIIVAMVIELARVRGL